MQAPRTRKIGGSIPEIKQKWMVTAQVYVELAYGETLGCWGKAGAEEGKLVGSAGTRSVRTDGSKYL